MYTNGAKVAVVNGEIAHIPLHMRPTYQTLFAASLLATVACGGAPDESNVDTTQDDLKGGARVECQSFGGTSHPSIHLAIDVAGRTMTASGASLASGKETVKLGTPNDDGTYLHFSATHKNGYEFAFPKAHAHRAAGNFTLGVGIAEYDALLGGPRDYFVSYEFQCAAH